MEPTESDLIDHTRIDAVLTEDSRYAYATHTYYGWRKEAIKRCTWRRGFKPIGAGGFGAVYREECTEGADRGAVRAVKHIRKPVTARGIDYGRELEAVARFSKREYEPFFVRSEGWYEADGWICIVMELVPHGNLQQYVTIHGLPEAETRMLIEQTLQGVAHMHRAGYAHRDLKPQNLLVAQTGPDWKIKIADFGLSKRLEKDLTSLRTNAGTAGYMAPEVQGLLADDDDTQSIDSGDGLNTSYTAVVDTWAIGNIAFQLVTGELPFPTTRQLGKYVRGKVAFPKEALQHRKLSELGISFIQNLLMPRPHDRPSADDCLQHIWVGSSLKRLDPLQETKKSFAALSFQYDGYMSRNTNASASWNTNEPASQNNDKTQTQSPHGPRADNEKAVQPETETRTQRAIFEEKSTELARTIERDYYARKERARAAAAEKQPPSPFFMVAGRDADTATTRRKSPNPDPPLPHRVQTSSVSRPISFRERTSFPATWGPTSNGGSADAYKPFFDISPCGRFLVIMFSSPVFVTFGGSCWIKIFEVSSGRSLSNFELRNDWLLNPSGERMFAFSPDGGRVAFAFKTGWRERDLIGVLVYNLATGYLVYEDTINSNNSFILGFIKDGRLAYLSHADQGKSALKLTLLALPRTDRIEEFMIDVYSEYLGAYSNLSRDGAFVRGICGKKGSEQTYIYDVAKRNLSLYPRPSEEGRQLSQWRISPDGNLLALEYVNTKPEDDNTSSRSLIRLFDVSAGGTKEMCPPIEGPSNGQAFEFSPDGQHIISSSSCELQVWYLGAGSEPVKATFEMPADKPHDSRSMRISYGAAMLAFMTEDQATIKIWDIVNE